jgi:hypothetical protein
MARRTYFSFHYKEDVHRAWVVRNSWVTKVAQGERESAGFFDSSIFEAKEREDPETLKRFLRAGLENTSVTCVLVGTHTCLRRWVRYEILRSFMCGNGLLAVRIHSIAALSSPATESGHNPFQSLSFDIDKDRIRFREYMTTGWKRARDVGSMPLTDVAYALGDRTNHTFSSIFPIYDWGADDGYENLGKWIRAAAKAAGR